MYTTDVSSACVDTRVRVIKTKVRVIWSGGHIEVSTWSHYYGRSNSQDNRRAKPKGQLLPTRQKSHPISLKTWLVSKTLSPLSCIITMKETRPRQGASYLPSELSELITKLLGGKKTFCVDVCFYLRRERAPRRLGETSLYLSPHCATHGHHPNFPPLLSLPETAYTGTQSSVDCLSVITSVGTEQPCANLIRKRE